MRLATIVDQGRHSDALERDHAVLPLGSPGSPLGWPAGSFGSLRTIAGSGVAGLERIVAWAEAQPERAYRALDGVELGPAVPDPGAIYTIGQNYPAPGAGSDRPLVYAKLPASVSAHGALVTWDRSLTANVDAEAELGVVIGTGGRDIRAEAAIEHVFGYTCVNDISSRDPWLDGDQWLLGKSMPGFCPVGPWVVTRDEIESAGSQSGLGPDLGLGCTINGQPIQDGRTGGMAHSIDALIVYLSRHVELRPGDLIATGTPARLAHQPGPERHLRAGDTVSVWIDQVGELTTRIG